MKNIPEAMYSVEERLFIILEYHRLNHNSTATRRSYKCSVRSEKAQMGKQFVTCSKNFSRQAMLRMRYTTYSVVTPKNAPSLAACNQRHPTTSVSRLAAQSGITPSNTWRNRRKTLHDSVVAHHTSSSRMITGVFL